MRVTSDANSIPQFSYVALHDLVIDVSPSDRKHIYLCVC